MAQPLRSLFQARGASAQLNAHPHQNQSQTNIDHIHAQKGYVGQGSLAHLVFPFERIALAKALRWPVL